MEQKNILEAQSKNEQSSKIIRLEINIEELDVAALKALMTLLIELDRLGIKNDISPL